MGRKDSGSRSSSKAVTARPQIRTLTPPDFGGVVARQGFAYQDHAAVQFCLMMLDTHSLKEVWCETYDDIVVIWDIGGQEAVEFVQVKAELLDQLWTVAKLCARVKSAAHPNGEGTSILEKSLSRDNCAEPTQFRLVTVRDVKSELKLLKLGREHADRQPTEQSMIDLCTSIQDQVGDVHSPNGNRHQYWVKKVQWECHDLDALQNSNRVRLLKLLDRLNVLGQSDTVEDLYEKLLAIVKKAAELPWTEKDRKMIKKEWLVQKVKELIDPFPNLKHDAALNRKLSDAQLDTTYCETAKELRRQYNKEVRQPKFLDPGNRGYFDAAVLTRLLELRSKFDSGLIQEDPVAFHQRCLDNLRELHQNRPARFTEPPEGFLQGCMYEITARCKHRFVKIAI